MLSRKYQTAKRRRDLHKPITTSLWNGRVAWTPTGQSWLPALWALSTAICLSSDWLAGKTAWALIGWQSKLPGSFHVSINKHLQYCHLHLVNPCSICFLLLGKVQGSAAEVFCSTCRSKGPWLYGDGEAHTEYVQNDSFFVQAKLKDTRLMQCPFCLGPSTGSWGLPSHSGSSLCFLCRDWKKEEVDPPPSPHSSFRDTCWGCIFTPEKLFTPPNSATCPDRNEWERCSGYSRSREQWGTSETNPLGTLKQIKKTSISFSLGNYRLLI